MGDDHSVITPAVYEARIDMGIAAIEKMTTTLFQEKWKSFHDDTFLNPDLRYPGVYLLAYTHRNIKDERVAEKDVLYVGMSNAQGGVRTRLKQFRRGLERYGIHSAAMRFYREHQNGQPFTKLKSRKKFYYAALPVKCISEKAKLTPTDLRKLGHVSCLEYYAIAHIREKTGHLPPLNKFGKRPPLKRD